jgi:deoxyribonuclease V
MTRLTHSSTACFRRSHKARVRWAETAVKIAFLDVHYEGSGARAACVLGESWKSQSPSRTDVLDIATVEPYEPGKFFRRELPCLLSVLRSLPSLPELIVVDGYVWLSADRRPGLGAYLYDALGRRAPVVGIAKTAFAGMESCSAVARVFRGSSQKPLFVTAVGIDLERAEQCVRQMGGKHRIPEMARIADRLSRGETFTRDRGA